MHVGLMSGRFQDKLHAVALILILCWAIKSWSLGEECKTRDKEGGARREPRFGGKKRRQVASHSHDHPSGFRRRKGKGIRGARGLESAVPHLLVCGFVKPTLRILASLWAIGRHERETTGIIDKQLQYLQRPVQATRAAIADEATDITAKA